MTKTCNPRQRQVLRMPSLLQDSIDTPNPQPHPVSQIPSDPVDLGPFVLNQKSCTELLQ